MQILISKKAIDFIICQEVTSPAYYDLHYLHPMWPQGDSGVTIGIGYDLGYHTMKEIVSDWFNWLHEDNIAELKKVQGITGRSAYLALQENKELQRIVIYYQAAYHVFIHRTLPKHIAEAVAIYPGIENLLPDAIGAIISMVFNRGSNLNGDRRKEMRAIVDMVKDRNYEGIAEQIDDSKRLWQGQGLHGIIVRREGEARLVRNSLRQYSNDEVVKFDV